MSRIRPAEPRDAPALAELAERSFRDAFGHLNRPEDMDLYCESSFGERIQSAEVADPGRATLVCEQEGRLIGYGQLVWSEAPACVAATRPVELLRLYVDRTWHGRGVAQALMASLLEAASERDADVMWLGVWERNPRAIAFYAKSGFSEVGDHEFVLGREPQRDLVMARKLDG